MHPPICSNGNEELKWWIIFDQTDPPNSSRPDLDGVQSPGTLFG
jgi:hypothetical protein